MPRVLTEDQVARYREDGFLFRFALCQPDEAVAGVRSRGRLVPARLWAARRRCPGNPPAAGALL